MDGLEGVAESRVSWDGRLFRIALEPGADPVRVSAAASSLLEGPSCCPLPPPEAGDVSANPDGRRWLNVEETVEMSREEARHLAQRFHAQITDEVALDPAAAGLLFEALRAELQRAFEQAHAAGGGLERLQEQLPSAWPRFDARLGAFLSPEQHAQVAAAAQRLLGG